MRKPGIQIDVPARCASDALRPIVVTMTADMPTYYACNGILDRALQVVLVRRDGPGVAFMAKTDPGALFLPEPDLPAPRSAADLVGQVSEERSFLLTDYGAHHDGAASYFVLATFAHWASEALPMAIEHRTRSVGAGDALPVPARSPLTERLFAARPRGQGVWAQGLDAAASSLTGVLRVPFRLPLFRGDMASGPWVTVVAWQPSALGAVAALSQRLEPRTEGVDHVAAFSIPLEQLAPRLGPGRTRAWAFSGDHCSAPIDFEIAA